MIMEYLPTGIFLPQRMVKGKMMEVVELRKMVFGVWCFMVLQKKVVVANLDDFVMIAQAKFTKFNIFSFTKEEVRNLEDFLNQRYLSDETISNFLRIEDAAICGDLV